MTSFSDLPTPRGLDPLYFNRRRSLESALKWSGNARGTPRICIDVGANVGQTMETFLEWWPESSCISFEPHPEAFQVLEERAAKFGSRAVVRNLGVSDSSGLLSLNVSKSQSTQSSFRAFNRSAETASAHRGLRNEPSPLELSAVVDEAQIEVPVVSLDQHFASSRPECDMISSGIDVLKSDTQGWELNVLAGAERTLSKTLVVLVEWQFDDVYGKPAPLWRLDALMSDQGFRLWDVAHIYKDISSLRTLWVDLIYARPSS